VRQEKQHERFKYKKKHENYHLPCLIQFKNKAATADTRKYANIVKKLSVHINAPLVEHWSNSKAKDYANHKEKRTNK